MPEQRAGLATWGLRVVLATLMVAGVSRIGADPVASPIAPLPAAKTNQKRIAVSSEQPLQIAGLMSGQVRSVLNVRGPMEYGQFVWNDEGVPAGPVLIRVDRDAQTISVFRGGHEIGTAVILYGVADKPTPAGRYPVLAKKRFHQSSVYDAEMPYTLALTGDGIAIHESDVRKGKATHGCIGLPRDFARMVFDQARVGDPVVIV